MKKYLFIVLLVGVWSCEDTKKDENDTLNPIINFKNLNSELNQINLSGT